MNRPEGLLAGGGRAGKRWWSFEGSSAIEDGGPAAVLATPDLDRMHILIRSSQLEASYVGDLLYYRIHVSQCHGDHL